MYDVILHYSAKVLLLSIIFNMVAAAILNFS